MTSLIIIFIILLPFSQPNNVNLFEVSYQNMPQDSTESLEGPNSSKSIFDA